MGIDEPGNGQLALEVQDRRPAAYVFPYLLGRSHGHDPVPANGQGFGLGQGFVHGDDLSADENHVGGGDFLPRPARPRGADEDRCRCRQEHRQQPAQGSESPDAR